MSDQLSKDEVKAMIEVQSKNTEQLTIIAGHLSTIVDRENKIQARLYNGMAKEITDSLIHAIKESMVSANENQDENTKSFDNLPSIIEEKIKNSDISKDINLTKWFVGIVGLVIMISTVVSGVILSGIDRRNNMAIEIKRSVLSGERDVVK